MIFVSRVSRCSYVPWKRQTAIGHINGPVRKHIRASGMIVLAGQSLSCVSSRRLRVGRDVFLIDDVRNIVVHIHQIQTRSATVRRRFEVQPMRRVTLSRWLGRTEHLLGWTRHVKDSGGASLAMHHRGLKMSLSPKNKNRAW